MNVQISLEIWKENEFVNIIFTYFTLYQIFKFVYKYKKNEIIFDLKEKQDIIKNSMKNYQRTIA